MARYLDLHPWEVSPVEAVELQKALRDRLTMEAPHKAIHTIAGTDISFNRGEETVYAGVVVLSVPSLEVIERSSIITRTAFPYIPGLLSFREIPALIEAWALLETEPDAVMVDGHGYAHPRRMGIAAHFGLVVDRPTIGCAKSVLVGRFEEPEAAKGSWSPMIHRKEVVGAALRTRAGVSPIYVSVGNRTDLESSIRLALQCSTSYRIPEPTRLAHNFVNVKRRGADE